MTMLRNNNPGRDGQEKKTALSGRSGLLENTSAPQPIGVPKRFGPIEVIFLGEIDRKARVEVRNTETDSSKTLDIQVGQIRSVNLEETSNESDSPCATCVELMLIYVSPVSASIEVTPSIDVSLD